VERYDGSLENKIAGILRLWRVLCPVNRQQHLEQCLMKIEWQLNLEVLGESRGAPEMNEDVIPGDEQI
jgi:tRNA A22 N-methylase